jgi:hypothetical protein
VRVTVEIEGERRPACVADTLSLYVTSPPSAAHGGGDDVWS